MGGEEEDKEGGLAPATVINVCSGAGGQRGSSSIPSSYLELGWRGWHDGVQDATRGRFGEQDVRNLSKFHGTPAFPSLPSIQSRSIQAVPICTPTVHCARCSTEPPWMLSRRCPLVVWPRIFGTQRIRSVDARMSSNWLNAHLCSGQNL